jgi:hypothetical protein
MSLGAYDGDGETAAVAQARDADYDLDDASGRAQAALTRWHLSGGPARGCIPLTIHKVWFDMGNGPRPPRATYGAMDDALEALHPPDAGWTIVRWGRRSAERLLRERFPDFVPVWASYASDIYRVDAIRYFILLVFGGVYVDQDVEPLRSFLPMIQRGPRSRRAVLVRSRYWLREISNFVMAAEPGSPLMAAAAADLPRRAASLWHTRDSFVGTMSVAGPRVLIAAFRRLGPAGGVCVLGPSSFAPVPPGDDEDPDDAGYGLHGFKSSWGVGRKIVADVLRLLVVAGLVLVAVGLVMLWRRRR